VHKLGERFFVIIDEWSPSLFRGVLQVHSIDSGDVAVDGRKVRDDGGICEGKADNCQGNSK
jgi:hypothetical protein